MTVPSRQNEMLRSPRQRLRAALFGALLLGAGVASADDFRYSDAHETTKSGPEVWKIMSAYSETCHKGCKYGRPNLKKIKKLSYGATNKSWYTWSHVQNPLKDVKFFTRVSVERKADGNFVMNNTQLTKKDAALIEKLEKSTGLTHAPAFDSGNTRTVTKKLANGKTEVHQVVTLKASGVVAMWPAKIREGIRKSVAQTFKNIGK